MARPPGDDHRRVSAVLGRITGSPVVAVDVLAGGFTDALVYRCRLADDRTVVSKSAPPDDDEVATALRTEALVLATRPPAAPDLVGFDSDERVLVTEYLADIAWLPSDAASAWPGNPADVTATLSATADAIAAHPGPAGLRRGFEGRSSVWSRLTDDALIAFGLTEKWLQQVRPAIEADARTHEFIPSVLVHGDLKGANLGLRPSGDSAVVDWSGAHLGDPDQDRVEFRLFARMAGVRDPRTPTPEQRSLLAVLCGLLLEEAIASASWTIAHAREASRIKRATARAALEWYGG